MFNLENWQTRGPEVLANEFRAIQDENYRVNREFYRVLQDAMAVGVPRRELKKILRKRGLSQKRTNLLFPFLLWGRRLSLTLKGKIWQPVSDNSQFY